MAKNRKGLKAGLAALAALSLLVCMMTGGVPGGAAAAQITFVPHVTPLMMTQTADALKLSTLTAPASPPVAGPTPAPGSAWVVPGITSKEALDRCIDQWGNEARGMCLAPGGHSYLVWVEPNTVPELPFDAAHVWQESFQQAAEDLVDVVKAIQEETTAGDIAKVAFVVGAIGSGAGCGTVFLCALALSSLGLGAFEIRNSGSALSELNASKCDNSRDVIFYYCMMQGYDVDACAKSAGIGQPCGESSPFSCSPRSPCLP